MHIPDGYLSPSTCAGLYAASAPFWYIALKRLRKALSTRMIPLLSVLAAFSFVIMMFNLPLPGGTTGHAVGMGIAAIVIGPWASMIAISVALLIQAVFFGDGGITAIGANCFNMAIVGSAVAYVVYRAAGYRAAITSTRRMVAAGLAGYAAINVAAFCAAIEFGIQPLFFHDASGVPLYAPYSLSVAIPAMMIGHLTLAGFAEFVISAGIVAYLQRSDPGLLRSTAPDAGDEPHLAGEYPMALPSARKLWIGLAALLILTPMGILATGSAWGEWTAHDLGDRQTRQQITAVSRDRAPPSRVPLGMERLASIWAAPISRYSPAWIRSPSFGYLVSGMIGVAVIIILGLAASRLLPDSRPRQRSFVEKTARHLLKAMQHALFAEEMAKSNGLLQALNAQVKLVGLGLLLITAISTRRLWTVGAILCAGVTLAVLSRIPLRMLITRIWITVLVFTGLIALPAIFLTPGQPVYRLPFLLWPVTSQGLSSAAFLILRAETAATLSVTLILTTFWSQILRALRVFHTPVVLVVILGMTYRYIFLFLKTAQEMFEAREVRLIGSLLPADGRRLAAASAGVLLGKSLQVSSEVHTAMQARGFRGEIHVLHEPPLRGKDWLQLGAFAAFAAMAVWLGR